MLPADASLLDNICLCESIDVTLIISLFGLTFGGVKSILVHFDSPPDVINDSLGVKVSTIWTAAKSESDAPPNFLLAE